MKEEKSDNSLGWKKKISQIYRSFFGRVWKGAVNTPFINIG
jgi:hypothetical protein